ncbi:MAG: DUF4928 family protein [Propionibacteriaceae bacterium]|nr:DUF4928 family protein [Propionibacteriaceae bacterium]
MDDKTRADLERFQADNKVTTKGPLSLVVQLSDALRRHRQPWQPQDFLTENKGQVAGLGGANLKKILARHGITRILSAEGGRTSRGNMGLMMKYIDFMNRLREDVGIDYEGVEEFWAEQVGRYFHNQPFTLNADATRTLGANLDDLFQQARKRQSENPGTQYLGTMLQHLIAAKLSIVLPAGSFQVFGAAVADAPSARSGDFVINDTVVHCTTSPGEPLIRKCEANLNAGAKPIIITLFERVRTALDLAADAGLAGRVDVWDVQQFLATNVNERSLFDPAARAAQIGGIIAVYNQIIDTVETDPSLRIEFEAN